MRIDFIKRGNQLMMAISGSTLIAQVKEAQPSFLNPDLERLP